MEALLIIDMQNECFNSAPRHDREGTAKRINAVSQYFRNSNNIVIFIQHDGTKENYMFPNTKGWQIIDELEKGDNDIFINKVANDAFYNSELDNVLKKNSVNKIYITGLATDFCVNATIHSALVKDYNIIVVKDCHTTADRPGLKAVQIIDFHNWLWPNLTPTNGKIEIKSSKELID